MPVSVHALSATGKTLDEVAPVERVKIRKVAFVGAPVSPETTNFR